MLADSSWVAHRTTVVFVIACVLFARYPAGCFHSELTGNQEAVGAVTTVEWVDIAQPGLLYTYT